MATPTSLRKAGLAVTRRASSDQGAVTLTGGVALAGTLTGTIDGTLADIAASAGACEGSAEPSAAQVDTAIATAVATIVTGTNVQLKELQALLNKAIADVVLLKTLVNEQRTALINLGAIKGSA